MNKSAPGIQLPDAISAPQAWSAFDRVFSNTDWRLQIVAHDPIALAVEHDAAFEACLAGVQAWQASEQAKSWIANRVLSLAASLDKTAVRRLCLQIPRPDDDQATVAFLTGLKRRIKDDVRSEIANHFDTSVAQWEEDALAFAMGDGDPQARSQLFHYTGLDQRLSVEAARKALKWIHSRTFWWLEGTGKALTLKPDYRFDIVKSERGSMDETTRARSLVARCVEVIVDEGVRRAVADDVFAPVTRASIKADLNRIFQKDGAWGFVHLTLVTDRRRYHLIPPPWQNARASELIERQDPYLFEPALA